MRALPQVKINISPIANHVPLKQLLNEYDSELTDQVVAFNASKVRKLAEITDKEIQVGS